jgi:hypothetical protein
VREPNIANEGRKHVEEGRSVGAAGERRQFGLVRTQEPVAPPSTTLDLLSTLLLSSQRSFFAGASPEEFAEGIESSVKEAFGVDEVPARWRAAVRFIQDNPERVPELRVLAAGQIASEEKAAEARARLPHTNQWPEDDYGASHRRSADYTGAVVELAGTDELLSLVRAAVGQEVTAHGATWVEWGPTKEVYGEATVRPLDAGAPTILDGNGMEQKFGATVAVPLQLIADCVLHFGIAGTRQMFAGVELQALGKNETGQA